MKEKNEMQQITTANGAFISTHNGKRSFKSSYGWFTKIVSTIVNLTMLWQSAAYAGAFEMSFSAVKDTRAHRRSGFFKPSEVREQSEKKRLLIHQRNALAKNLNKFNRDQSKISVQNQKLSRNVAQEIMREQRQRDQRARDLKKVADEGAKMGGNLAFYYVLGKQQTYPMPNGEDLTLRKRTYFKGGRVIATFGDVLEGRDGSLSIKNTYNMEYDSALLDEQPSSYSSVTYDVNTGMVTKSDWSEGEYWSEEDVENDDVKDLENTSGNRVKGKLAGYKENVTTWYPGEGDFDAWDEDAKEFMFVNNLDTVYESLEDEIQLWGETNFDVSKGFNEELLRKNGFEEGVTSRTERSEMRYYTEEDELENKAYVKDQMASYHEIRSSVEDRFSDTPALVTEVDWYGAEYDWAFKNEDDYSLVYDPGDNLWYIDDFVRTQYEIENKDSVSMITSYKEHSTDNIGHDSSREWSTFVKGGISDDGSWRMDTGYDKYGRTIEYKDISTSVEGTSESHRWDIDYWDWDELESESMDEMEKRWSFGQVNSYSEQSTFQGPYASTTEAFRLKTTYDRYGRMIFYKEHSTTDGINSSIEFVVNSYRSEGWVSNLMKEYEQVTVSGEMVTKTMHNNMTWDEYGQVLLYHEIIESTIGEGLLVTEVVRLNIYKPQSYLLEGFQEFIGERGYLNGELEYANYSYHQRFDMQYNQYNQLNSYKDLNVSGIAEEFWFTTFGGESGYGTAGVGVFPSFTNIASSVTLENALESNVSFLDNLFSGWGVATLSSRYNIGYNDRNLMSDYLESSWQFGETEVDVPILDDSGEVQADSETGDVITRKDFQKLDVRTETSWFGGEYDAWGNLLSYTQVTNSSLMAGVTETRWFMDAVYDAWNRQVGFREETLLSGMYDDDGVMREINARTVREREWNKTRYNDITQLFGYSDIYTDANGAVSYSWQTDAQYDYRNRIVGYVQENIGADNRYSRVELFDQVYNNVSQVVSYTQHTYDFAENGDLRSKTEVERRNSLYNANGQVVFYNELSRILDAQDVLKARDFQTYRAGELTVGPQNWLTGENIGYTEYDAANDLIIDYIVEERDEEGHPVSYIRKEYRDDDGDRGDLVSAIAVKNYQLDDFGYPQVQKRFLIDVADYINFKFGDVDWDALDYESALGSGVSSYELQSEAQISLLAKLGVLEFLEKPEYIILGENGERYLVREINEDGKPVSIEKVILDEDGIITGHEMLSLSYDVDGGFLDEIAVRVDQVSNGLVIAEGEIAALDDDQSVALINILSFSESLEDILSNEGEKIVSIKYYVLDNELMRRIRVSGAFEDGEEYIRDLVQKEEVSVTLDIEDDSLSESESKFVDYGIDTWTDLKRSIEGFILSGVLTRSLVTLVPGEENLITVMAENENRSFDPYDQDGLENDNIYSISFTQNDDGSIIPKYGLSKEVDGNPLLNFVKFSKDENGSINLFREVELELNIPDGVDGNVLDSYGINFTKDVEFTVSLRTEAGVIQKFQSRDNLNDIGSWSDFEGPFIVKMSENPFEFNFTLGETVRITDSFNVALLEENFGSEPYFVREVGIDAGDIASWENPDNVHIFEYFDYRGILIGKEKRVIDEPGDSITSYFSKSEIVFKDVTAVKSITDLVESDARNVEAKVLYEFSPDEYKIQYSDGTSQVFRVLQRDDLGQIVRYESLDYDETGKWVSGTVVDKLRRIVEVGEDGIEKETGDLAFEIDRDYVINAEGFREYVRGEWIGDDILDLVNSYLSSLEVYSRDTEDSVRVWWSEGFEMGDPESLSLGYNNIGKIGAYHEESITEKGTTVTDRSSIKYNLQGMMEAFHEVSIDPRGRNTTYDRSNIT